MKQAPRPTVKQATLVDLVDKHERIRSLLDEATRLAEEVTKDELFIIAALDRGEPVEPGLIACGVSVTDGQRRPAWKDYFATACGPEAVERAIRETAPSASTKKLTLVRGGTTLHAAPLGTLLGMRRKGSAA